MKNKKTIILLLICVIIAIIPLALIKDSEFSGADGLAVDVISEISPDYKPWATPLLEPPGSETESLLFCLQASIGSGILGYCIGILKERHKKQRVKTF